MEVGLGNRHFLGRVQNQVPTHEAWFVLQKMEERVDPGRIRARKVKVRVKEAHHTYSTRTSSVIRAQRASTSSRFSPKTMA